MQIKKILVFPIYRCRYTSIIFSFPRGFGGCLFVIDVHYALSISTNMSTAWCDVKCRHSPQSFSELKTVAGRCYLKQWTLAMRTKPAFKNAISETTEIQQHLSGVQGDGPSGHQHTVPVQTLSMPSTAEFVPPQRKLPGYSQLSTYYWIQGQVTLSSNEAYSIFFSFKISQTSLQENANSNSKHTSTSRYTK